MRKFKIITLLIIIGFCYVSYSEEKYIPMAGDIIFQSLPHGELVDAIEGATQSPFSHVGIVVNVKGKWVVREAITNVHDTVLENFIKRGREQNIAVYRLKEKYKNYIPAFLKMTELYLGHPYDIHYRFDDEYIYCSELVYKAFKDASGEKLGEIVKLGDLNWGEYKSLIISIEGGPVPKKRLMITPRDLAKAIQLKLIYTSY